MLLFNLQRVVDAYLRSGIATPVIKNLLKEYLQLYVLDFIYNSHHGKRLIFTGGSCLRFCFGLNRISEDLDLDSICDFEKKELASEFEGYFAQRWGYKDLEISISGRGEKIYLKFPILTKLGLAKYPESNKLYVKVEIEKNPSDYFDTTITPINRDNFSFLLRHYDLATMMAGKIACILTRTFAKGKGDKITFKGRDYYDLLWYLQRGILPNMQRIKTLCGISAKEELLERLKEKIASINLAHLKEDIINLFENPQFVEDLVRNYKSLVIKYVNEYCQKLNNIEER